MNYKYDNIGNMTQDKSEGGKTVTWNVYNKITTVSMSSGTKTLAFGYDAGGNRVRKESTASGTTTKQWYVRDAQGNIMSTYKQVGSGTLKQEHVYLYGSTRVGEYLLNRDSATTWNRHYYRVKGNRHYELTNHLGNVLAVVTDRKMAKDTTADATYNPQFFMPDVYSVQNYYAFGQSMPNWSGTAAVNDPKKYRFGYNGKEDDDEWGKQDYGARIYDPRIGRWLSTDPLEHKYSSLSTYNSFLNNPNFYTDPDGKSGVPVIDDKNKTITIHSKFYFYGGEATEKNAQSFVNNVQSLWGGANGSVSYNGENYKVLFEISHEIVSEDDAKSKMKGNRDAKNNFVRVESTGASHTGTGTNGSNSFFFGANALEEGKTTAAHEYGHSIGLIGHSGEASPENSELYIGQPDIMTTIYTPVEAEYTKDPSKGNSQVSGFDEKRINPATKKPVPLINNPLDSKKRKVTQTNFDNLKINPKVLGQTDNIYYKNDGEGSYQK